MCAPSPCKHALNHTVQGYTGTRANYFEAGVALSSTGGSLKGEQRGLEENIKQGLLLFNMFKDLPYALDGKTQKRPSIPDSSSLREPHIEFSTLRAGVLCWLR